MNELLDVIESMYIEAERENNIIIIPINSNFKLYLELEENDLAVDIIPTSTFANIKLVRTNVETIVSSTKQSLTDNYLYDIIELVSDYLNNVLLQSNPVIPVVNSIRNVPAVKLLNTDPIPMYKSSDKKTIKKSIFIAHVCKIQSQEELALFVSHIHQKFPDATHHILAYCITLNDMDYDDDGEDGAAHRVLFMMKANKLTKCAVIISRWFGGVKLGPSRFKIIANVARQLLEEQGWITKSI